MVSKYYAECADIRTMLYRYTVLSNLFGVKFDNTTVNVSIPDDEINQILNSEYSEQKERVLFLCAAGVLRYNNIRDLIIKNNTDYLCDVIELEKQLIADEEKNIDLRTDYVVLEQSLLVAANSKKSELLVSANFAEVCKELRKAQNDIAVVDGYIACSKEYCRFLREINFKFVKIDPDTKEITEYKNLDNDNFFNNIIENALPLSQIQTALYSEDIERQSKAYDTIFVSDGFLCLAYLNVYNKMFGKDFIRYTVNNNISVDASNIDNLYNAYIDDKKLTFSIKGYIRRRKICGNKINHYDYDWNTVANNELIASELKSSENFTDVIKLQRGIDIKDNCSDDELIQKALKKYKRSRMLPDRFLAEIFFNDTTLYYVYSFSEDKFSYVNGQEFSKQLFDFNKVWGVVRKAASEHKIVLIGDEITFPYLSEIAADEQQYAIELAREQYERQKSVRKSSNKISTLKQLLSGAESKISEKEAAEAEKANKYAEAKAKMNNRIVNTTTTT